MIRQAVDVGQRRVGDLRFGGERRRDATPGVGRSEYARRLRAALTADRVREKRRNGIGNRGRGGLDGKPGPSPLQRARDRTAVSFVIADASAFPNASGVNPMLTVMALARRNVTRV